MLASSMHVTEFKYSRLLNFRKYFANYNPKYTGKISSLFHTELVLLVISYSSSHEEGSVI